MNEALMSSKKHDWETPQWLYDKLNETFKFTLDVCAHENNCKNSNYFSEEQDGLMQKWEGVCWMNPPYKRYVVDKWMKKAVEEASRGALVVGLIAARTETKWFQECATLGQIYYLKGRLKFEGARSSAPFPSALVIWRAGLSSQGTCYIPASVDGIKQLSETWK